MANITSKLTNIGSTKVLNHGSAAGKNPTDNDAAGISGSPHNLGNHPIGHWGGAEVHCNFDTSGKSYVKNLQKYIPAYDSIKVMVNATANNMYGSTGTPHFCLLQGSIDNVNWVTLGQGVNTPLPDLKDVPTHSHWIIDELKEESGPVLSSAGRWPYLQMQFSPDSDDNSGAQVKTVILA